MYASHYFEEVQLAVGEALCFAFGNVGVTPAEVLEGSFTTLSVTSKMLLTGLDDAAPEAGGVAAPEAGGVGAGGSDAMDEDGAAASIAAPTSTAATAMDVTDGGAERVGVKGLGLGIRMQGLGPPPASVW
jgi:hypothetical protein